MKLRETASFLHPVLTPRSDDYGDHEIQFECEATEVQLSNEIEMQYSLEVTEPYIKRNIQSGAIGAALSVVCLESAFNRLLPINLGTDILRINGGSLHGRTRLRPVLVAFETISPFEPENLHQEYDGRLFTIHRGDVLGFGEERVIHVGIEKLAAMESIFRISMDEALPEGNMAVDMEDQSIEIKAAPHLYNAIQQLRNNPRFKPVVLNSIYLPAVMHILNVLAGHEQDLSNFRWHRIFVAKCEISGIDPNRSDPLAAAQILLCSPLSRLERFVEDMTHEP